jgi:magnesium chelatase subunit D
MHLPKHGRLSLRSDQSRFRQVHKLHSFIMVNWMEMQEPVTYPFTAIVDLDDLKLGLILNVINPRIGGLLIRGSKGSGKTTAVRSLPQILSHTRKVRGCPFNCNPDDLSNMCDACRSRHSQNEKLEVEEKRMKVVELPLGATEDRVVGSLDVEKAIKMGIGALEPGILAEANQNILYVDEINLLPDHIADDLLDAAATGWNMVEREGISVKHPSRFVLIGTMNPEEGQIRPQLLDRLALSVEVSRILETKNRIEVVRRNMEFEDDPEGFARKYGPSQEQLKQRIDQARKTLPDVKISDKLVTIICELCLELKVDGMRPDIVIAKTAKTLAAFEGRTDVVPDDVLKAAELTLSHRTREGGFLEPATSQEIRESFTSKLEKAKPGEEEEQRRVDEVKQKKNKDDKEGQEEKRKILLPFGLRKKMSNMEKEVGRANKLKGSPSGNVSLRDSDRSKADFLFKSEPEKGGRTATFAEKPKWTKPRVNRGKAFIDRFRESRLLNLSFTLRKKRSSRHAASNVGKRAVAVTSTQRGRVRGWDFPRGKPRNINLPATVRTAARAQKFRNKPANVALSILPEDVREKQMIYRAPLTIVFALDLSESMFQNIDAIREVMLKLHNDAYRYRDKVGIVTFKEMGAVVVQYPTTNLKMVASKLLRLRLSGFTPLAAGMSKALEILRESKRRDISTIPAMVIVTDGDANVPLRRDLRSGEVREFDLMDTAFYKFEDEAIKDVISVCGLIKKENVYTVVVNTLPVSPMMQTTSGSFTTRMIASMTSGVHYELAGNTLIQGEQPVSDFSEAMLHARKSASEFHYLSARAHMMLETSRMGSR